VANYRHPTHVKGTGEAKFIRVLQMQYVILSKYTSLLLFKNTISKIGWTLSLREGFQGASPIGWYSKYTC